MSRPQCINIMSTEKGGGGAELKEQEQISPEIKIKNQIPSQITNQ